MELEKKVIKFIKEHSLFDGVHEVAVATSGGADSMALLTFLNRNKEMLSINNIIAIHVNHGIRGDTADRDEKFVVDYCREHKIECIAYNAKRDNIEVPNNASEIWARELRYNYFERAKKEHGYDKIAIAHTASDQAETIVFRIARGTGLKGISGIHKERGDIVRPFMCLDREEIEELCRVYGISYITDETNLGEDYSRNKIRHRVIPTLKQINDRAVFNLVELSDKVSAAHSILEKLASSILGDGILRDRKIVIVDKVANSLRHYIKKLELDDLDIRILCEYIAIGILDSIRINDGYSSKKTKGILNTIANSLYSYIKGSGKVVSVDITDDRRLEAKTIKGSTVWVYKNRNNTVPYTQYSRIVNSADGSQYVRVDELRLEDYLKNILKPGIIDVDKIDKQIKIAMHNRGNFKKFIDSYCDRARMHEYTGKNCRNNSIEVVFGSKVHKRMGIEIDGLMVSVKDKFKRSDNCAVVYSNDKVNAIWVSGIGVDDRYLPTIKDRVVYRIQSSSSYNKK